MEHPLVSLLHLVRRHSTTDDGLLIRRQVHDRKLTVLTVADTDSDYAKFGGQKILGKKTILEVSLAGAL